MLSEARPGRPAGQRVVLASTVISAVLLLALVWVSIVYGSRLARAQAADSLSDIFTALALLASIRIAARPPDEDHPFGHQRAEPIAALLAAVVAGVLAVEVLRDAVGVLVMEERATMGIPLLLVFVAKVAAKVGIAFASRARQRAGASPALRALYVDARNDVAVGCIAVVGFFGARYGWVSLDAWFAIPVGVWVGWSGFDLARENIHFLMGAAPPEARRIALIELAAAEPGVMAVRRLRAVYHGSELDVLLEVVVDPELTMSRAHDIGHGVERRLTRERDVVSAVAHIDVDHDS